MGVVDIIIMISALAAVVGVIGWQIYKKKTGKGCGCGCGSCPNATACGAKKTEKNTEEETCIK